MSDVGGQGGPPRGALAAGQRSTRNYLKYDNFQTMDTRLAREGLPPNRFAWLENLQIRGDNQIQAVAAPLPGSFSFPGHTAGNRSFYAVGGHDFIIVFCTDGSLQACDITAVTTTQIAPPGSFSNPDMTGWQGVALLIADPLASYSVWNGSCMVLGTQHGVSPNIVITNGGTGFSSTPTVSITGGSGSGATAIVTGIVNGSITQVTLTNGGTGYLPSDVLTVTFGGPGAGATATAIPWVQFDKNALTQVNPFPSTIAIFQQRVWLAANRALFWSGTQGYDDWNLAHAAGITNITDDDMVHNITALRSLNNFLWIFGDNSIKQIGTITVTGSTTNFTIVTLTSDIGTIFPMTILSYQRLVIFANPVGVFAVLGSSVEKISDEMDGIFELTDFSQPPCAALADINNQRCYLLLIKYNDPVAGARNIMLTFQARKWFVTSQGSPLSSIGNVVVNGLLIAYGAVGSGLIQLFAQPNVLVPVKAQTALAHHGKSEIGKRALRVVFIGTASGTAGTVTITLDSENLTVNSHGPIATSSGNFFYERLAPFGAPVQQSGVFLGFTLTGNVDTAFALNSGIIEYQDATVMASTTGG